MSLRCVALLFVLTASCQPQSVVARSRFVEDGVQKAAGAAWSGERIEIDNAGVTAGGGVAVSATSSDRVVATARMLAVADTYDKPSADQAIVAATDSFVVATNAGVTAARCGHGAKVGSVAAEDSGCDALDVSVPLGAADKLLTVVVRSGDGKVGLSLGSAALAELDVHATNGAIDATTSATQGASLTLVSETGDVVTLRLPRDFAADALVLDAPAGAVDTSAFPDVQSGKSRGDIGRGARSITVRAGRIVLAVQQ
jgi:hypothetical protein